MDSKFMNPAVPRERVNEVYQKIDEYLHGLNSKKIDVEKAYETIIDAPNLECNAILNVCKDRFADPRLSICKSSRVEKNKTRANEFYRQAVELDIEGMAEGGDKYAQVCLGWMYRYGKGVDLNDSRAVEWYRKATEQGYADGQYNLGSMYQYESIAVELYFKAAEQGHTDAQYHLGHIYRYGYGVDQNKLTAVKWYRKAAEQGHAAAQFCVGLMYQCGYGVEKIIQQQWNGIAKQRSKAMLMVNVILDGCISMETALIEIIQQQWNGIGKQRSKAMLLLNVNLD